MNYQEVKDYLYQKLAFFQRDGAVAFKKDLSKTIDFLAYLGNPERSFRAVHIAGTNGKGSSAHSIAAVLQRAGYKTGLYTSPHLLDFSERIRLDGIPITEAYVIDFVLKHQEYIENARPSFFEVTVAMSFQYFADMKVDIAVVETGMGGRLDSTNLVDSLVCLITNIGYDHQQYLGETLPEIAREKAGIIKKGVHVVIGERQEGIDSLFVEEATSHASTHEFASDIFAIEKKSSGQGVQVLDIKRGQHDYLEGLSVDMLGTYYLKNIPGVLAVLARLSELGFSISEEAVRAGLSAVKAMTGLQGRWQMLNDKPFTFCDVGHNIDGIKEVLHQIAQYEFNKLHMVYGTVNDKEIGPVIETLPKDAIYYLCRPNMLRGLSTDELAGEFESNGLKYSVFDTVQQAVSAAKNEMAEDDFLFIGGSTFVVAEIPELRENSTSP